VILMTNSEENILARDSEFITSMDHKIEKGMNKFGRKHGIDRRL
jgi:hypothetical protein